VLIASSFPFFLFYFLFLSLQGASLPKLAQRLAATMSMAILPMESIDVVYREMRDTGARREPLFKSCQELLLLIASTFPKLMTHPQTTAALFEHINIGLERENEVIVTNTLLILREIKDPTAMQADKKLAESENSQLARQRRRLSQHRCGKGFLLTHSVLFCCCCSR
jgi:hypothetical protein